MFAFRVLQRGISTVRTLLYIVCCGEAPGTFRSQPRDESINFLFLAIVLRRSYSCGHGRRGIQALPGPKYRVGNNEFRWEKD